MRKKLLDISKKIDNLNLEILKKIKEIADSLQIDFFIVGATVRDMILGYVYGINIYRGTNDIDFAVRVKNWDEYNLLISEIEQTGFIQSERIFHRYTFNGMIIDVIPFGEVSGKDDTVAWPDNDKKGINIIGFEDVYIHKEELLVQIEPEIIIPTSSVEGLVLLKLFSWNDRALDIRIKDAMDLYIIITSYLKAGNERRLFDEHNDIIDDKFDYELGGSRLLGRDIANLASAHVKVALLEILNNLDKIVALSEDMAKYESIHYDKFDDKINWCKKL